MARRRRKPTPTKRRIPNNPMGVPDAPPSVEYGIGIGDVPSRAPRPEESAWGEGPYEPGDGSSQQRLYPGGTPGFDESTGKYVGTAEDRRRAAAGLPPRETTQTPGSDTSIPSSGAAVRSPNTATPDSGLGFYGASSGSGTSVVSGGGSGDLVIELDDDEEVEYQDEDGTPISEEDFIMKMSGEDDDEYMEWR